MTLMAAMTELILTEKYSVVADFAKALGVKIKRGSVGRPKT
jgi:hypothetical protein